MVYVYLLLFIVFNATFSLISRTSLTKTKYEYAYTIVWQVFCALLSLAFLPFDSFSFHITPQLVFLFVISACGWALNDAFFFSAYKYEEASVISAITPISYLFAFMLTVLFFHAHISLPIIVGFIVIMMAIFLVGFYKTRLKPTRGVIFALLSSVFTGIALATNTEVVKSFSIPVYMFVVYLFPAIVNQFLFLRPKLSEIRYEIKMQWKLILLNAAVIDIGYFFFQKSFQIGTTSQIIALSSTSTIVTVIAAILILKERKNIIIKILAGVLATIGVILVQL